MKLRTKIFLLIGGLFLISFLISQIAEEFVTGRIVEKNEVLFDKKIREFNESKRDALQTYLQGEFDVAKAEINTIMYEIQHVRYWRYDFAPSEFNIATNTWLSSAILLTYNKRLDLIQNLINDKIASMIVMDEPPHYRSLIIPMANDVKIVVVDSQIPGEKLIGPYLAVPYNFNELIYLANSAIMSGIMQNAPYTSQVSSSSDLDPVFYLFFDLDYVLNFDATAFAKKLDDVDKHLSDHFLDMVFNYSELQAIGKCSHAIYQSLLEGQQFLKTHPDVFKQFTTGKEAWFMQQFKNEYDIAVNYNEPRTIEKSVQERYVEINKIWQLLCLNATGIFNYDPLSFGAPLGLCSMQQGDSVGQAVMCSSLLYKKKAEQLSNHIYYTDDTRIFLGDKLTIADSNNGEANESTLTLAVDLRNILSALTLATQNNVLFVVNDKVVKAYDSNGDAYRYNEGDIPLQSVMQNNTGSFVDKSGNVHYFLTIWPIRSDRNLRVILHNTIDKEYAMIEVARKAAEEMRRHIGVQMSLVAITTLIVVMILIHSLSKKITTPISILYNASHKVAAGNFDEIDLPENKARSEDEIDQLYKAFAKMVSGLKEKEKVKGVLNKVVSPQIANKILEGQVELGGEEKVVTVLFADIRHFTELSQNIPPTDLLKVLNRYMTIMSKVVDQFDGVIDKYVGDEVMALFGAPLSSVESAHRAVDCALEMIREVAKYNETRRGKQVVFDIGVGIHTGIVVAGNMGAENRMNYTVLGSNVNLASRLCAAAAPMQILISKETLSSFHVKEGITYEELKPITLKGFSEPVPVFAIHAK